MQILLIVMLLLGILESNGVNKVYASHPPINSISKNMERNIIKNINIDPAERQLEREQRRNEDRKKRKIEKKIFDENSVREQEYQKIKSVGRTINSVKIAGNTVIDSAAIGNITKKYIGRTGHKSIIKMIDEIESLYFEKGYITSRVNLDIDSTNMDSGEIYIKIIEGRIETIQIKNINHAKPVSTIILSKDDSGIKNLKFMMGFPIKIGDVLNINTINQGIENYNMLASNSMKLIEIKNIDHTKNINDRSYVRRSSKSSIGNIVILENKKSSRVHGSVGYDNLGSSSTGKNRIDMELIVDDIVGINDTLTARYRRSARNIFGVTDSNTMDSSGTGNIGSISNKDEKDSKLSSIEYTVPFKYWELSVYRSRSEYLTTGSTLGSRYKATGVSRKTSFEARRLINRDIKNSSKTTLGTTIIRRETDNYINNSKLDTSSRRLTVLKVDLENDRIIYGGAASTTIAMHRGIKNFGAETDHDKRSIDPRAEYKKYSIDLEWYKPFTLSNRKFAYRMEMSGQYSSDTLYSSEKLSLGDDTTVRGYKEFSVVGDSGAYLRNEIEYIYGEFRPFIAYDMGYVKENYIADEIDDIDGVSDHARITGATIGVRAYLKNLEIELSYSKAMDAPKITYAEHHEIYLSVTAEF